MRSYFLLTAATFGLLTLSGAVAQESPTPPGAAYKTNVPPDQRRAFFGEMHLHTTMSFDAWTFGTKVTPDQAYKFGRGETVMVPAAQVDREEGMAGDKDIPAKRAWPLDFMAVTDHSEAMGVLTQLDDPNNPLAKTPIGQMVLKNPPSAFFVVARARQAGRALPALKAGAVMRQAWDVEVKAANDNYEPGKFTTFIAYEWSARVTDRQNPRSTTPIGTIHRNVFFNSDYAPMPFSSADSEKPEDLWSYLEKVRAQGIDVIAIPHNGNLSGGMMYDWNDSDGRPIDELYAQRRALNEPLTEIVQNKGQSDTVPVLSPSDEFANFEIYDRLLVSNTFKSEPNGSYIRQAFGRGLVIQSKVGVNPFKYGVVGASDIHNGLSASDESSMASGPFGIDPHTMLPAGDAAKRALGIIKTPVPTDPDAGSDASRQAYVDVLKFSSAGLTGVWAEENTRNSIFAALKRKETFATSGTRIRVRMFGGWDFEPQMIRNGDWVRKAYARGVAMGGDLPEPPQGASAPRFILQAVKDPDGANLDRIQIIKLWLDGGDYKEKLFDVALSGNRKDNLKTGRAPGVGNTVDLKTGGYRNTIGASVLTTVWQDPEFNPAVPAVYYARVLEIPTPRWSTLLAIKSHLPIPKDAAATIQERAWTSPIWFTPAKA
ncbi:MAG TPA: DUF3604 domain-containing protein [Rhizomicrobium sp.]|nr:DUF3604 domain-containing protein [Rhizomicrobium sp.]